jgi:hypothetical protein
LAILIGPAGTFEHDVPPAAADELLLAALLLATLVGLVGDFELLHAAKTIADTATTATTMTPRLRPLRLIRLIFSPSRGRKSQRRSKQLFD